MSNPLLDRYPHPGKFEGELNLTERLYEMSLEFGQTDDCGSVEDIGWHCLFTELDKADLGDLDGVVAAILSEDSQGFVSATYFETEADARAAWQDLQTEYDRFTAEIE
jgi:hypothetical protein